MQLNEAVIPHYQTQEIPIYELKKQVYMNEPYLKEKPTWCMIGDELHYFKIRNDFRLFTEQFFSMFAKEILDLDTLDYKVSLVRTMRPGLKKSEEVVKVGLLSKNFQSPEYNYYLVSELLNSQISDFISYGGYTLKNLLAFFKDHLDKKAYTENELFLIKLFIADGYTHQEDRNCHNIGFKIPKIEGIPHTKRLRAQELQKNNNAIGEYVVNENGIALLKHMTPTPVYDSERILGTDHRDVFTYQQGQVWCPLFPFKEGTRFISQEQGLQIQKEDYYGMDPNLFELFIEYEKICKPLFERLAYESEYKKILERFTGNTSQIILSKNSIDRLEKIFEDKQKSLKRILSEFK